MGTAYRYWRCDIVTLNGLNHTLYEFQLRVARDGTSANLAVSGNGTMTALNTGSGSAANLIDGNTSTQWSSTVTPNWLQWDFGAGNAQDINHVSLYSAGASANHFYAFSGSNDLATWERRAYKVGLLVNLMTGIPSNYPLVLVPKASPAPLLGPSRSLPAGTHRTSRWLKVQDVYFGGLGRLSGHVKIRPSDGSADVPAARRVILIDERANRIIKGTWSRASDGYFEFTDLNASRAYTTMVYDYAHSYRAVPADNLTTV